MSLPHRPGGGPETALPGAAAHHARRAGWPGRPAAAPTTGALHKIRGGSQVRTEGRSPLGGVRAPAGNTHALERLLGPRVGAGGTCVTEAQTPTQCSHGGQMPTPRKTAGEIPGFPDSAYRAGRSTGVEARLPASRCQSQIIFSRSYFRASNFVNNLRDQSTDNLPRPFSEAEGHRGGRRPTCTSGT